MWKVYDTMIEHLPDCGSVVSICSTDFWTLVQLENGSHGLAMTTDGDTRPTQFPQISGLPCREAAKAVKSWNLPEASVGMAAINACYNTMQQMEVLGCAEPYERYCTHGLDFTGKTVGIIGHLKMPEDTLRLAKDVYILERHPQSGDYPDSACEYLLPHCDFVLITGSTLVNKTLSRLLQLCENAYTILTGPTVPMCPELLNCGIDRLAGLVVDDFDGVRSHVEYRLIGSPYPYGKTFLLSGDRL